jgi:AdoMet-dependent rRNA methyltransferase SPB1
MGFSKKTGKGRLDKYYYLAKEHGYRARSAFKIKQLNQKFGFFEKARVVIDLCAAPGGWLQVAAECMPMSHVIIGADLVPIKPIKGVTTIVGDITTEKCRSDIKKELKGWKADVVLHDGAPNVGNAWIQDAFSQAELALHSFKLASEFLCEGGVFVTKVFRSKEYPLVLGALKKYFKKVEATKPDSSRSVSAEIFVFCKGFQIANVKADPIVIKNILEGECENKPNALTNILHPEKKRVNRDGYEDNVTILHKKVSLSDYLNSKEPDQVLAMCNEILISGKDEEEFISAMKNPDEIRNFCKDLKVIGRKEFKIKTF